MRTIIYTVFDKTTNKRVYTNCRQSECEKFLATYENKENAEIRYKWFSI